MFHDEGASTDVTGMGVLSSAEMTDGKGSRTSPEKLKPFRPKVYFLDWNLHVQMRKLKHTKDGVDDMMCVFQVRFEIFGE